MDRDDQAGDRADESGGGREHSRQRAPPAARLIAAAVSCLICDLYVRIRLRQDDAPCRRKTSIRVLPSVLDERSLERVIRARSACRVG
jgi:hypothetical protein